MLKNILGRYDVDLAEKMRTTFVNHLGTIRHEINRRRIIISYLDTLARSGQISLLDYATAHDADLVGLFEEQSLRRVAAFHEKLMA